MELPVHIPSRKAASDTIDFAEITALLRRRFWIILGFFLAGTLLALVGLLIAVPQFTAHGALYLGDAQSTGGNATDSGNLGFSQNFSSESDIETQIEMITSRAIVQEALLETGVNAQIVPAGDAKLRFWRWRINDRGKITAFLRGRQGLQALYASVPGNYAVVLGEHGTYGLYMNTGLFDASPKPLLTGRLGQPASGGGIQLLIKPLAPNFQDVPGKIYNLTVIEPGALADYLLGNPISVTAGGSVDQPTKIAFLQFRWSNPYQAQALLNQIMQDFIATQLDWKTQSASTTEAFVASQLKKVSSALAQADQNLAQYQAKTGIMEVPLNAQAALQTLTQYSSQQSTLMLKISALQQLNKDLRYSAGPLNPYLASQADDTVLSTLTSSLAASYVTLAALEAQYFDGALEIRTQQAQIARQQEAIRAIARNDLATAQQNLSSLNRQMAQFKATIASLPADSLKMISLQRTVDVLGKLYVLLMEKEQEAEVSKAETIVDTRIITPATPPNAPTSPKAAISVIFGGFAGLVAGVVLAFGRHAFSGRFESEEQMRKAIELPVLAVLPNRTKPETNEALRDERGNPALEAFRLLRSSLYRMRKSKACTVILLVSAEADGNSTIAKHLAGVLADDGSRTALINGDLYRPDAEETINHQPQMALFAGSNEGKSALAIDAVSRIVNVDLPNRPNEIVLKNLFVSLRKNFDFIILDSPPLPGFADGMTLGIFSDVILSVVSLSKTSRRSFANHTQLIATLNRNHGIIINQDVKRLPYKARLEKLFVTTFADFQTRFRKVIYRGQNG